MSDAIPSDTVVVDASVWISAFITEDVHHSLSRPWLDQWLRTDHIVVGPSLVLIEVAGAITRRTGDQAAARRAIDDLRKLPYMPLMPLDETLTTAAAHLAIDLRLRGADAVYAALAWLLAVPLITWDAELLTRASGHIDVRTPSTA